MAYSNFTKVSTEEGFAVGAAGSEREIINSSGVMYMTKLTNAGAVVLTSVTTAATTKGTFTKGDNDITLTIKNTLTRPVRFYKYKLVGKTGANAAIKVVGKLNGVALGTGCATTKTKSTTSISTASTNTKPVTGKGTAPYFSAVMVATLDTTMTTANTKKGTLSVATLSVDALEKVQIATIT